MRPVGTGSGQVGTNATSRPGFLKGLDIAGAVLTCAIPALLVTGPALPDIALSLAALSFLVRSGLARDWSWLRTPWVLAALAVWAYLLLDTALAVHPQRAIERSLPWGRFVLFAAALQHWVLAEARWRRWLLIATGVVLAFVAADTFVQFFAGRDLFGIPSPSPYRLTGPMGEGEVKVGVFVAKLMFPVLLAALAWSRGGPSWYRLLAAAAVAVGVATVLVSGERTPLLLIALGIIAVWLLVPWLRRGMAVAAVAAALVVAVVPLLSPAVYERSIASTLRDAAATVETIGGGSGSFYGRIWRSSVNVAMADPLFGVGLKSFRSVCPDSAYDWPGRTAPRCSLHPHNFYLEWWAEAGTIGLVGFLVLVFLWGRHAVGTYRRWAEDPVAVGAVVAVIMQLWPLQATMSFFTSWNAILFWLMLGWALAASRGPGPARSSP